MRIPHWGAPTGKPWDSFKLDLNVTAFVFDNLWIFGLIINLRKAGSPHLRKGIKEPKSAMIDMALAVWTSHWWEISIASIKRSG
jgi:hypothetical protein